MPISVHRCRHAAAESIGLAAALGMCAMLGETRVRLWGRSLSQILHFLELKEATVGTSRIRSVEGGGRNARSALRVQGVAGETLWQRQTDGTVRECAHSVC